MKKVFYLFIIAIIASSCADTDREAASEEKTVRDGIFIHVSESYNDPHRVLMPFKMATLMADDKDVILYLDIHAVELVRKGAEDVVMDGFEPLSSYIALLLEKGVDIYACPTCMAVAGIEMDELMDGIKPANKDAFFGFTQGRILSVDY